MDCGQLEGLRRFGLRRREKVERWGKQVLVRPDPQAIWPRAASCRAWDKPNAVYHRSRAGGGEWEIHKLPAQWAIHYGDLTFQLKPMSFKHTGLFPEQAANWDFIDRMIRGANRPINVLNLTRDLVWRDARCRQMQARRSAMWTPPRAWCSGRAKTPRPAAWLTVDPLDRGRLQKVRPARNPARPQIRRDHHGPALLRRGPSGETWKIEEDVADFVELTMGVLSDKPLFVLISSYSTGLAPSVMSYLLGITAAKRAAGRIEAQELGLPVESTGLTLPCGSSARFIAEVSVETTFKTGRKHYV